MNKKALFAKITPRLSAKIFAAPLVIVSLVTLPGNAPAQGSLTPPGPPGPTMKSLDQIEPRTPIASLPFNITTGGAYYLTGNLTGVSGSSGIKITVNDVTLDLKGFSLIGVPGSKDGITIQAARTTVMNGNLSNWGADGVNALGYQNNVIKNLIVANNGATGIDAGGNGLVESCVAETNVTYGIAAAGISIVRNCTANGNGSGIYCYSTGSQVPGTLVTGCTASQNGSGIVMGQGGFIVRNLLLNNSYAGVSLDASGSTTEDNSFNFNYNGVATPGFTNLVIRNSFKGNTNTAILGISPNSPIGPLITGATMATNSNPAANYSY